MRIGLLGGSFDPIHYGHLRAADWAASAFGLDQTRLMPAAQSPFKPPCIASAVARVEMIRLALSDNPLLALEECEVRRPAPSYTIDSLVELKGREPGSDFVLLVGSDAAEGIDRWHRAGEVKQLAELRVVPRVKEGSLLSKESLVFEGLSISSTALRNAVKHGRSIRYLTPEPVRRYIEEMGLYR